MRRSLPDAEFKYSATSALYWQAMKHTPWLHWLTALALFVGQWSLLAHASEHRPDQASDALCTLCVQGQSLEQMQLVSPASTPPQAAVYITTDKTLTRAVQAPRLSTGNRDPPFNL